MLISKEFKFDAAHNLVNYHGKCERLHGHTYRLRVTLEGTPDKDGMILDFTELKKTVNDLVVSKLDHSYINDTIAQPSAENISLWVWKMLETSLSGPNYRLYEIIVWETEDSFVTYRG
ncbi:MAG: 6-carboxytetrahydropterin synthase QueD [Thermotogae bacterium]|nr:6-carboxytetrahydropterin synthase QueD [Thermotogota bacterium]MCL5031655.1 6-carboxytetrahydropterin synthase QueD [Thermotogota bacterium]